MMSEEISKVAHIGLTICVPVSTTSGFARMEKARVFDPFGHVGLTPLGKIRLTLADEIKMTPVEASAGEFFCSFETPCPGTAGINLKNYRI